MKKFILSAFLLSVMCLASIAQTATGSLAFKWDPNTEPDLAGYEFYTEEVLTPDGLPVWVEKDVIPGQVPFFLKRGIRPGKLYRFSVLAFDDKQRKSDRSESLIVNTAVPDATAPSGLNIVIAADQAVLSWTANPEEQDIIQYHVSILEIGGNEPQIIKTKETSISFPINPDAYYILTVTAFGPMSKASSQAAITGKLMKPKRITFEGKITWELDE